MFVISIGCLVASFRTSWGNVPVRPLSIYSQRLKIIGDADARLMFEIVVSDVRYFGHIFHQLKLR